jgi:hypothetical protein
LPYAIEDCIPATAIKKDFFAVDVYIDSPTTPSDTSNWIGLELLKNKVGQDYQTSGILIVLHYNGTIEVLGAGGIDFSTVDSGFVPLTSTTFSTHWNSGMTKITIHMVQGTIRVYVDDVLTIDFQTEYTGGFHSLAKYGNLNALFDTFIMRSYVEPNPDQTIWGTEEFKNRTIVYTIDEFLAKLNIPKTCTIDTIMKKLNAKEPYEIDAVLKKLDVPKTDTVDAIFAKLDIPKVIDIDSILRRNDIKAPFDIDAILEKCVSNGYLIDFILLALVKGGFISEPNPREIKKTVQYIDKKMFFQVHKLDIMTKKRERALNAENALRLLDILEEVD